jgi:hypothetical protein
MTLVRVLRAELLKMRRTIALKMVVLAPAVVLLLILFMASEAPFSTLHRNGVRNEWANLVRLNLWFWALLMLPLYITLETALLAGIDHSDNQWKSLFARPVPRWTFFVAKLTAAVAMTGISTFLLLCGMVLSGLVLPHLEPQLHFDTPVPWAAMLQQSSQIFGLVMLALTIQHWVSLRWRSFSVAIGTGIIGTVIGFFAAAAGQQVGGWPQYFPWALPILVVAKQPHNIPQILAFSSALAIVVAVAGCWEFCRREVQ